MRQEPVVQQESNTLAFTDGQNFVAWYILCGTFKPTLREVHAGLQCCPSNMVSRLVSVNFIAKLALCICYPSRQDDTPAAKRTSRHNCRRAMYMVTSTSGGLSNVGQA